MAYENGKYAVYFKWNDDGMEDSFNVDSYKDLKFNCVDLIKREDVELLEVCKISYDGEYLGYDIPKAWYK